MVTLHPEIRDAVKKELGVFSWPTHVDSTEKARPSSHRAQLEQSNSVKSLKHIPASHTVDRAADPPLHWLNERQSSPSTSEDHVSSSCTPSPIGVFHDVFWTLVDNAAKPLLWSCCISSYTKFYVGLFFSAYLHFYHVTFITWLAKRSWLCILVVLSGVSPSCVTHLAAPHVHQFLGFTEDVAPMLWHLSPCGF